MSELPEPRRAFLGRLASLPLVGGAVAVLGDPAAAAELVDARLLDRYDAWLEIERQRLRAERYGRSDGGPAGSRYELVWRDRETGDVFDHVRGSWIGSGHRRGDPEPSTRAAAVLDAVSRINAAVAVACAATGRSRS